ncbi:hypothetical protein EVAR_33906_1 [Eumeta japonica]|uniref:Uncharacterized protein n=1 Tax=Eumeta variegata TaxID=151549 RepID=A0A4C1WM11_EUMVA|nr:hypothetical protein EVAR_33906_1 [Eumeta japonica]
MEMRALIATLCTWISDRCSGHLSTGFCPPPHAPLIMLAMSKLSGEFLALLGLIKPKKKSGKCESRPPRVSCKFTVFKRGRVNLRDELSDDRPSTAVNNENIDVVRCMIEKDRHITYHEIRGDMLSPLEKEKARPQLESKVKQTDIENILGSESKTG